MRLLGNDLLSRLVTPHTRFFHSKITRQTTLRPAARCRTNDAGQLPQIILRGWILGFNILVVCLRCKIYKRACYSALSGAISSLHFFQNYFIQLQLSLHFINMSSSINKIETDLEKGSQDFTEISRTGRTTKERTLSTLSITHKARANPSPLGLLSFAACLY